MVCRGYYYTNMRVKEHRKKPMFKYKIPSYEGMKEEKGTLKDEKELVTCMLCGEEKEKYYTKKLFTKTYDVCEDCSRKAKEQGTVNTLYDSWFSDEDIVDGTEKAKSKLAGMSDKKKAKLTKKLKMFGYEQEQIDEAINKIQNK